MIVIYRFGDWRLIESPQDPTAAWDLADLLTSQTGVRHYVGRL